MRPKTFSSVSLLPSSNSNNSVNVKQSLRRKRRHLFVFSSLLVTTMLIKRAIWQQSFSILTMDSVALRVAVQDSVMHVLVADQKSILNNSTLYYNHSSININNHSNTVNATTVVQHLRSKLSTSGSNNHHSSLVMPNLLFDYEDNTTLPSTSACIMFSDDDQRLVEWIAYHYYTAGLRTLIVSTNPLSFSSPKSILDRWRPYMQIVEWQDSDFGFVAEYKHTNINEGDSKEHVHNFLVRQTFFYEECIKYLQKLNSTTNTDSHTWSWFHDVDEYVTLDDTVVPNASAYMGQPSGLLKAWKHSKMNPKSNQWLFEPPIPANNHTASNVTVAPCYSISLRLVSAKNGTDKNDQTDEDDLKIVNSTVPDFLEASRFETMQFRYRVSSDNGSLNGLNKCMLDVNRVKFINDNEVRVHRVTTNECPGATPGIIFQINHYLGSWRLYARPSDSRRGGNRNWQMWHFKSQLGKPNDTIQPWLKSFVEHVGTDLAKRLLQHVPLSPVYNQPINMSEWVAPPEVYRSGRIDGLPEMDHYIRDWLKRYDEAVAKANMTNSSVPLVL